MKIYSLLIGVLVTLSASPSVADKTSFGIGAAVNDGVNIYFPIKTEHLLIEPTLAYIKTKNETTDPFSFNSEDESIKVGVGIFKNDSVLKDIDIYYGARIGYIKSEHQISPAIAGTPFINKSNGYFIAPTIGAAYYLIDKFSIGLDVSINYANSHGDVTNGSSGTSDTSSTTTQTAAEIIVRYHF